MFFEDQFSFVNPNDLSRNELEIFKKNQFIIELIGGLPIEVHEIKISETMVKEMFSSNETLGCWDPKKNNIIISRKQLRSLSEYSGTLIHEIIHAKTGFGDVNREFETELTKAIGIACNAALKHEIKKKSWFGFGV